MLIHTSELTTVSSSNTVSKKMTMNTNGKVFSSILNSLYSNPHGAMVRELSANAVDVHRAANNPEPFQIQIPTKLNPVFIVRDFGTGLNEAEIDKYLNTLFETSKDGSNDDIGGFGLGSKSPFALVSSYNIESYKDGVMYQALWYKEDEMPSLTVFNVQQTNEPNGIKFIVRVKLEDVDKVVQECFNQLFSFPLLPNIYTDLSKEETLIEDFYTKHISSLSMYGELSLYRLTANNSLTSSNWNTKNIYISMGGIKYPLPANSSLTNIDVMNTYYRYLTSGNYITIIEVPVGTLKLPMSREILEADTDNINKILAILTTTLQKTVDIFNEKFYEVARITVDETTKESSIAYWNFLEAVKHYLGSNSFSFNAGNFISPLSMDTSVDFADNNFSDYFSVQNTNYKITTSSKHSQHYLNLETIIQEALPSVTLIAQYYQNKIPLYKISALKTIVKMRDGAAHTSFTKENSYYSKFFVDDKTTIFIFNNTDMSINFKRIYEFYKEWDLTKFNFVLVEINEDIVRNNIIALEKADAHSLCLQDTIDHFNTLGLDCNYVEYSDIPKPTVVRRVRTTSVTRVVNDVEVVEVVVVPQTPSLSGIRTVCLDNFTDEHYTKVSSSVKNLYKDIGKLEYKLNENNKNIPLNASYFNGTAVYLVKDSDRFKFLGLRYDTNAAKVCFVNILKYVFNVNDIVITTEDKYENTKTLLEASELTVITNEYITANPNLLEDGVRLEDSSFYTIAKTLKICQLINAKISTLFQQDERYVNSNLITNESFKTIVRIIKDIVLEDSNFNSYQIFTNCFNLLETNDDLITLLLNSGFHLNDHSMYNINMQLAKIPSLYIERNPIIFQGFRERNRQQNSLNIINVSAADKILIEDSVSDIIDVMIDRKGWKLAFNSFYNSLPAVFKNKILEQIGAVV